MRIGIIGAGSVGSTLARAWANSGHQVALATRNPDDPKLATLALSIGPNASAGAVPRVVEHCEVVVLATPWTAVRDMPGVEADWSGKILIDCTNPLRADFTWLEDDYQVSAAERIAAWAQGCLGVQDAEPHRRQQHGEPGLPGRPGGDVRLWR
jgi:8-hydroxy-5-deazaflavin:NADPH oxidoreductase